MGECDIKVRDDDREKWWSEAIAGIGDQSRKRHDGDVALDFANTPNQLKNIQFCDRAEAALEKADLLVVATEGKAYRSPDFNLIKSQLSMPIIFDGRNLYDPAEMSALGIEYFGIGRMA